MQVWVLPNKYLSNAIFMYLGTVMKVWSKCLDSFVLYLILKSQVLLDMYILSILTYFSSPPPEIWVAAKAHNVGLSSAIGDIYINLSKIWVLIFWGLEIFPQLITSLCYSRWTAYVHYILYTIYFTFYILVLYCEVILNALLPHQYPQIKHNYKYKNIPCALFKVIFLCL